MATQLTRTERAYEHVRGKLLSGEIPAGQRLSESALAREMGVSRTPVREALYQLASEGLLERDAAGVVVRQVRRDELIDMHRLRRVLEANAAGRAARLISPREIEELWHVLNRLRTLSRKLRDCGSRTWPQSLTSAMAMTDMLFHVVILRAANSPQTLKIVSDFGLITMRYRHRSMLTVHNLATTLRQHGQIYRAIAKHDAREAHRAMSRHLRLCLPKLIAAFDQELRSRSEPLATNDWSTVLNALSQRTGLALDPIGQPAAVKRKRTPRRSARK